MALLLIIEVVLHHAERELGAEAVGIVMLGAALTGYFIADMRPWHRWLTGGAALLVVAPGIQSGLVGFALVLPVILIQVTEWRRRSREKAVA